MRRWLLLSLSLWPAVASAAAAPPTETEKLVALGRLYGVVRWFHPTDAAQELDWNRFAVHAARSVRAADSAAELDRRLEALFAPVGVGILVADALPPVKKRETAADPKLVAWRHRGLGFGGASPGPAGGGPYSSARTQRAAPTMPRDAARASAANTIDGFITLMQTWRAEELRGKTVRFTAQVKAERPADVEGGAALWLRVDREARQTGFFDNM